MSENKMIDDINLEKSFCVYYKERVLGPFPQSSHQIMDMDKVKKFIETNMDKLPKTSKEIITDPNYDENEVYIICNRKCQLVNK